MGFGELCFIHLGVKCKDRSNILGPDWGKVWPSWALLKYLEATALLFGAKLGDLEGKLGYREVMFKLSWAMLCYVMLKLHVRFCSAMLLVLHPKMPSPQQDQDFKWVSVSYVGSLWGQVRLPYGYVGAILGPTSAVLKAIWDHFGPCCFGIVKNNPKSHLRNAPPPGPEGETESNQKLSQNTKTLPKR